MIDTLKGHIRQVLEGLELPTTSFEVGFPNDMNHGDLSTNVALQVSSISEANPREVAEQVREQLQTEDIPEIERISVAGPGFINFTFSRDYLAREVREVITREDHQPVRDTHQGRKVMVEYTQPNPFKVFHIGHLMSNSIGEALTRLYEACGAEVVRANYQGDVGLHVAKALWGIEQDIDNLPKEEASLSEKSAFLGEAYVAGSQAYEKDEEAKEEIQELNRLVYEEDKSIKDLYQRGREWSLEHFEEIYAVLGTEFDHYFFESQTAPRGREVVEQHTPAVFEESEGAIVYKGEQDGLHTRVFITSQGVPTYEAKDLGLNFLKAEVESDLDLSIIVTAEEQREYMKVVLAALAKVAPDLAAQVSHVTHGMMQIEGGKMSSRKGTIISGEEVLEKTIDLVEEKIADRDIPAEDKQEISQAVGVAAVKYAILKQTPGKNIAFDFDRSISFEGDSGPYLQYTYVRCQSVLEKAREAGLSAVVDEAPDQVTDIERLLPRFPAVVESACRAHEPHQVVHYLVDLAQAFNTFYGNTQIIGEDKEAPYRLALTQAVAHTLKQGLHILGIKTVERM